MILKGLAKPPPKTRNARHSKENPNWQTPQEDIDCARAALGGRIELDVFSCASANLRVQADDFFGPDHLDAGMRDAFRVPWAAKTILENHPGGMTKKSWEKTCAEYKAGNFKSLIWIGFSVEQVCTLSEPDNGEVVGRIGRGEFVPTDFSLCFLRKRIHFIDPDKPDRPSRPGHANFICGIGTDPVLFERAYRHRGQIIHGALARGKEIPESVDAPTRPKTFKRIF